MFFRQADRLGSRTVLRHHQGGEWKDVSWAGLAEQVTKVAAALVEEGVAPGARVLLMSENRLEWIISDLAIMTAGAVTVPIYPSTVARVAQQIAENSQAMLAIVSGEALAGRLQVNRMVRMDSDLPGWLEKQLAQASPRAGTEPANIVGYFGQRHGNGFERATCGDGVVQRRLRLEMIAGFVDRQSGHLR